MKTTIDIKGLQEEASNSSESAPRCMSTSRSWTQSWSMRCCTSQPESPIRMTCQI